MPIESVVKVLGEVATERGRQLEKWGEQSHPDGLGEAPGQIVALGITAQAEVRTMVQRLKALFPNIAHDKMTPRHKLEVAQALEKLSKSITKQAADAGKVDWTKIVLEELCEAFATTSPADLRAELIQTAAVLVAWVEDLDRRAAPETPRKP